MLLQVCVRKVRNKVVGTIGDAFLSYDRYMILLYTFSFGFSPLNSFSSTVCVCGFLGEGEGVCVCQMDKPDLIRDTKELTLGWALRRLPRPDEAIITIQCLK